MFVGSKYSYALFNTAGEGGSPPSSDSGSIPPPISPSEGGATPVSDTSFSEEENWALEAFTKMNEDEPDDNEGPIPEPESGAQAPVPEGTVSPSQQTVATPGQPPASMPPAGTPAVGSPAPGVGVPGMPAQVVPTVAPPPPGNPTQTPEDLAAELAKFGKEFTDKLAKERYNIDPKKAEELGFTAEQAELLSRMFAAVHVEVVSSQSQMQAQQLPVYVQGLIAAQRENSAREEKFYGAWPQLRGKDPEQLAKVFQAVNTLNPDLKGEAWMKKAGEMACTHFGVPVQNPGAGNGSAAPAGQPQQVLTPGRVVRPNGAYGAYTPAGSRTLPSPPAAQKGHWDLMTEMMERDYD